MPDSTPVVSVVIVSYNCREDLCTCLRSLPSDVEVIVVDNASSDGSVEMVRAEFPTCTIIRNESNLGFGVANNIGLRLARGKYALLLNPDAQVCDDAVEVLTAFMETTSDAVACGGSLWFPTGGLQQSACNSLSLWAVFCEQTLLEKLFPRSRVLSPYWLSKRHVGERGTHTALRVSQVMGACLMMRRIEGRFLEFDERFFLYCEDTELCKRLSRHGSIWYVPAARFLHRLGTSSISSRHRSIAYYNRGKELYFRIHHGRLAAIGCFLLDRLGALIRALAWGATATLTLFSVRRFRTQAWLFLRVLAAPIDPYPPRADSLRS